MFSHLERPIIFAHRGASAYAPENTLAAFVLAHHQGAPAIELDVKLSRDGIPVVFHDATLNRVTGVEGKLSDFSLQELKQLDVGSHFSPRFRGEQIPTLEEVFDSVGSRLHINVELTNYTTPTDRLVEKVARLIDRMNLSGRILFSSFLPHNLQKAKRLMPQIPRGLLALPGKAGLLARSSLNRWVSHHALHPEVRDVDARLVSRQHWLGKHVYVWTVDEAEQIRRLIHLGVDGIFTNDPAAALCLVEECK